MKARENPFRTERVHRVRYRFLGGTWDSLMARLAELGYRAAVVGPDGSGKTTLLEDLAPRLAALGFRARRLFLNDEAHAFPKDFRKRFFADLGGNDIILFDGADLLGPLAWSRFKRRARAAAGLVITSHRPGPLPTLIRCETTPELLDDVVAEILGANPRPPDTPRGLFQKHKGNVRDALRELYDIYAGIA